ncbi:MAG: universal stress protein [Cyclobacteriaceae bacterium]|nr:universal stress protein [Cyclobacteriaceae bacterium]
MKAILCAIDLNRASEGVLHAAIELAAEKQTNVIALFAYRLLEHNGEGIAEYRKKTEAAARQEFDELLKRVKADKTGVPVEFITEIGFTADRIDYYVRSNKVSYIVLSRQLAVMMNEQKGLTFTHFINAIKIPVLIVPEEIVETV